MEVIIDINTSERARKFANEGNPGSPFYQCKQAHRWSRVVKGEGLTKIASHKVLVKEIKGNKRR